MTVARNVFTKCDFGFFQKQNGTMTKKSKRLCMWNRLQNAVYRPNSWILTQGYLWVKKYLHTPTIHLQRAVRKRQKIEQLSMLYTSTSILSDINYLLDSYRTAYRWRSLSYKIDSSTSEIVEDLISIAQFSGITENLEIYIKQYLALNPDHKESDLDLDLEAEHEDILLQRDKLNMFRPKEVIEAIVNEDDAELRLIKTFAYGAIQDTDIFMKRLQKHIEEGEILNFRHLYYCPLPLLDSPRFWDLIVAYKPQITTNTCEFDDLLIANVKSPSEFHLQHMKEYEDMSPFLHFARCEQNIEKMEALVCEYPTWKDPALCVRFFKKHGKMPKWHEFYSLGKIDPDSFLTKERPERFE